MASASIIRLSLSSLGSMSSNLKRFELGVQCDTDESAASEGGGKLGSQPQSNPLIVEKKKKRLTLARNSDA
eukprot:8422780-Ditylum_brightwellii.AAC.1